MAAAELSRHLTRGGLVRGPAPEPGPFLRASAALGLRGVVVDCRGAATKAALLARFAEALRFPAHFGMNLDALHDSLTDWAMAEAAGGALLLQGLHPGEAAAGAAAAGTAVEGPAAVAPADVEALLDTLAGSAEQLAGLKRRLTVFAG